jgi:hypothetical protein
MLVMLIDTPDPRYRGDPDPDEERRRRWEPVSWRQFASAVGSLSCVTLAPLTGHPGTAWALTAAGVALCAQFVRESMRDETPPRGDDRD